MLATSSDTPPSGKIDWHIQWKPLTDGAFVEPA